MLYSYHEACKMSCGKKITLELEMISTHECLFVGY